MKKTILNGQVLSEKEMKEVKGGTIIIPPVGAAPGKCSVCENTSYTYNGDTGVYRCNYCGHIIKEESPLFSDN